MENNHYLDMVGTTLRTGFVNETEKELFVENVLLNVTNEFSTYISFKNSFIIGDIIEILNIEDLTKFASYTSRYIFQTENIPVVLPQIIERWLQRIAKVLSRMTYQNIKIEMTRSKSRKRKAAFHADNEQEIPEKLQTCFNHLYEVLDDLFMEMCEHIVKMLRESNTEQLLKTMLLFGRKFNIERVRTYKQKNSNEIKEENVNDNMFTKHGFPIQTFGDRLIREIIDKVTIEQLMKNNSPIIVTMAQVLDVNDDRHGKLKSDLLKQQFWENVVEYVENQMNNNSKEFYEICSERQRSFAIESFFKYSTNVVWKNLLEQNELFFNKTVYIKLDDMEGIEYFRQLLLTNQEMVNKTHLRIDEEGRINIPFFFALLFNGSSQFVFCELLNHLKSPKNYQTVLEFFSLEMMEGISNKLNVNIDKPLLNLFHYLMVNVKKKEKFPLFNFLENVARVQLKWEQKLTMEYNGTIANHFSQLIQMILEKLVDIDESDDDETARIGQGDDDDNHDDGLRVVRFFINILKHISSTKIFPATLICEKTIQRLAIDQFIKLLLKYLPFAKYIQSLIVDSEVDYEFKIWIGKALLSSIENNENKSYWKTAEILFQHPSMNKILNKKILINDVYLPFMKRYNDFGVDMQMMLRRNGYQTFHSREQIWYQKLLQ
ncbi:hypothetical protein SNEBB_007901 [Seison nebaliae]|nr:hypothetical protein SNEBB_007901 [Seison nebaliae]